MFLVNNKNTRTTSLTLFSSFYCELWTYFTPFSSVSIVDFEEVNVSLECSSWHPYPKQWILEFCIFNPIQSSVEFYIGTSHFSCKVKPMTGFYMKCNTRPKWVEDIWIFSCHFIYWEARSFIFKFFQGGRLFNRV